VAAGSAVVVLATIAAILLAANRWQWVEQSISSWDSASDDGSALAVHFLTGPCADGTRVKVVETASTVQLVAELRQEKGASCLAFGIPVTVEVRLKSPLGDRAVVGRDGQPLAQSGP